MSQLWIPKICRKKKKTNQVYLPPPSLLQSVRRVPSSNYSWKEKRTSAKNINVMPALDEQTESDRSIITNPYADMLSYPLGSTRRQSGSEQSKLVEHDTEPPRVVKFRHDRPPSPRSKSYGEVENKRFLVPANIKRSNSVRDLSGATLGDTQPMVESEDELGKHPAQRTTAVKWKNVTWKEASGPKQQEITVPNTLTLSKATLENVYELFTPPTDSHVSQGAVPTNQSKYILGTKSWPGASPSQIFDLDGLPGSRLPFAIVPSPGHTRLPDAEHGPYDLSRVGNCELGEAPEYKGSQQTNFVPRSIGSSLRPSSWSPQLRQEKAAINPPTQRNFSMPQAYHSTTLYPAAACPPSHSGHDDDSQISSSLNTLCLDDMHVYTGQPAQPRVYDNCGGASTSDLLRDYENDSYNDLTTGHERPNGLPDLDRGANYSSSNSASTYNAYRHPKPDKPQREPGSGIKTRHHHASPHTSVPEASYRRPPVIPSADTTPPEAMWDYNEDVAAQDAGNEHREQNVVHPFPPSMISSIADSETQDSLRDFAARAVLVDQQLQFIKSDLSYCVRINRMLMEERRRMIREDVLGVKEKVKARDYKASTELSSVSQNLGYDNSDTDFSYATTSSDLYRQNRFERIDREESLRRTRTVHGERTGPVEQRPTQCEGRAAESSGMETIRPVFGRRRGASQPLPKPYVDPASRENGTIYSARQLVRSDDGPVKKNESFA